MNGKLDNPQWWTLDKIDIAAGIFSIVAKLYNYQGPRREKNLRTARMYGNTDTIGAPATMPRAINSAYPEDRVKMNVIASMSDTVTSKIAKMKPTVSFLTEGGSFHLGQEAQKISRYMRGAFMTNDIFRLHQRGFQDSTVFDVGALKHFIQDNRIVTERVLATELMIDDIDALYGDPRCLYQYKFVHKEVLLSRFPKARNSILQAAGQFESSVLSYEGMDQYAVVVEAWHLPSGDDAGDGRHVVSVSNGVLLDEEWKRDYFPFTFFRWTNRLTGFWGQSLADRLVGTQLEINKLLRFIQKSFHLGSAFKVFLEHGSRIAKEHLNNEIGSVIYYTGTKPEYISPKVVNQEVFQHLEYLVKSAYEEAGISQLSATSRKPSGIDSGKALREYNDIETERFAIIGQNYESSFLETAKQYIDLSKELYDEYDVDLKFSAESRKFIKSIKWSEIDLDKDQYIMQMFPVSMLPHTPAGRMQFVQELINQGFVTREFALKLLDFPDLESYESIQNAPLDDLLDTIDKILYEGSYQPPEPYQDLANGLKLFQAVYLRSKRQGVPESRLDLLRRWMSEADARLNPPAPPMPLGAPTPGGQQGLLTGQQPTNTQLPAPIPTPVPEGIIPPQA